MGSSPISSIHGPCARQKVTMGSSFVSRPISSLGRSIVSHLQFLVSWFLVRVFSTLRQSLRRETVCSAIPNKLCVAQMKGQIVDGEDENIQKCHSLPMFRSFAETQGRAGELDIFGVMLSQAELSRQRLCVPPGYEHRKY